jgi:hypothetical protein
MYRRLDVKRVLHAPTEATSATRLMPPRAAPGTPNAGAVARTPG